MRLIVVLVGGYGVVLPSGVTGAMGCCQRAVDVGWYQMIGCEWIVLAFALSTYPAGDCCVSDDLCSAFICACVVGSVWFRVLSCPCCLAGVAAWCVRSKCATG